MSKARSPWYRDDPYSGELIASLRRAVMLSEQDRRQTINDASLAQFAYERERWRFQHDEIIRNSPNGAHKRYLTDEADPALNQIKSMVDKFVADLLQATPGLAIQTTNGRYEDFVQDKIRTRLLQGMLDRPDFRDARRRWIRQGVLERVGWIWPCYHPGSLKATQLQQYQVFYDSHAALHKDPPDIHVAQLIDRVDLKRWYSSLSVTIPEKKKRITAIEKVRATNVPVPSVVAPWIGAYRQTLQTEESGDRVRVVYSWRKSWRTGEPDGRAVVSLLADDASHSIVLLDRPFDRTTLPIVWWSPWETSHGIDGISIADSMMVTDFALARIMHRVNQMMLKHGATKLIIPRDEDPAVGAQYLSHNIEVIFDPNFDPSDGTPSTFQLYQLNPSEMAYIDFLMSRPAGLHGISQQALQGSDELSPGASGIARLQAKFQAIGRQRGPIDAFATANKRLGDEVLYAADDAVAIDPKFRASYSDGGRPRTVPWSTYALTNENRRVVVAEVGVLGNDPAGQIQALEQLAGTGQIPADAAAQMIADQPDIQRLVGMVFAPREAIQRHLSILSNPESKDEWTTAQPTEDMDLKLAVRLATQAINAAIADQAKPETLQRLRAYSLAAQSVLQETAPASPQPPTE